MHKKTQTSKAGMCLKARILSCWKPTLTMFFQLLIYLLTNQFAEVSFKYAIKFRHSTLDAKVLLLAIELWKNRQKEHLR